MKDSLKKLLKGLVTFKWVGPGMFLVFLLFLYLKLAGIGEVAGWSWWWVTCPLWGPITLVFAFWLAVVLIWLLIAFICLIFES